MAGRSWEWLENAESGRVRLERMGTSGSGWRRQEKAGNRWERRKGEKMHEKKRNVLGETKDRMGQDWKEEF